MENFGDILKFLVFVAVVVLGVIGRAKKQIKKLTTQVFEPAEEPLIPAYVKEWEGGGVMQNEILPVQNSRNTQMHVSTTIPSPPQIQPQKLTPILQKTREFAFETPTDARRAFIYSEIFNRKY